MPHRDRDDLVRQLWMAGFSFQEDLPTAHLFVRGSERVLLPKRESAEPVEMPPQLAVEPMPGRLSPCCGAESKLRRIFGGMIYFRCTACTHIWDQPAGRRHVLRVVK